LCGLHRFARSAEEKISEQIRRERRAAERLARAAAWEAEKAEARANRVSLAQFGAMHAKGRLLGSGKLGILLLSGAMYAGAVARQWQPG
jgi:hypothetical protein